MSDIDAEIDQSETSFKFNENDGSSYKYKIESPLTSSSSVSSNLTNRTETPSISNFVIGLLDVGVEENSHQKSTTEEINNDSNKSILEYDNLIISGEDNNSSNQSRELKSLLALSKDANLDTNIPRKRLSTSVVGLKKKSSKESSRRRLKSRKIQYPVTAESELEMDLANREISNSPNHHHHEDADGLQSYRYVKRKKSVLSDTSGDGDESFSKRSRKSLSGENFVVFKPFKDMFCWRCHKDNVNVSCETCARSYHQKCLKQTNILDLDHWPCPECVAILKAESIQSRSAAMKEMTLEHLCSLLKFAAHRMIQCQGSEPFIHAVNDNEFPEYKKYIIQPMDLTLLEKNIKENLYGSPQAFEADAKWILHNSIVFNSYQSKLTNVAKTIIKVCKQEMAEIENCPSCYLNANTKKKTWFVEVCPKPHLLVWAKLRGFPFWPGKAMSCKDGMVDVRFFGAHDRAWVPAKECYLYTPKDPNLFRAKRSDIEQCVDELELYVANLKKIHKDFSYPPFKTPLDPDNELKQLRMFLPKFKPSEVKNDDCCENSNSNVDLEATTKEVDEKTKKKHRSADETMEGYGTDDESMQEIDTVRRNLLKTSEILEADEDDTQVSANVEIDATDDAEKIVLTRNSLNKSKSEPPSKRPSFEGVGDGPNRRNSDPKTDSDMSLGQDLEHFQNISSSKHHDHDYNADIRKKPIQVNVNNVEFTISPTSKLKMADKLIKRLSDNENIKEKVDLVKKNLNEEIISSIEPEISLQTENEENDKIDMEEDMDLEEIEEMEQEVVEKVATPKSSPNKIVEDAVISFTAANINDTVKSLNENSSEISLEIVKRKPEIQKSVKRRLTDDSEEMHTNEAQNKVLKLVSVDNILDKTNNETNSEGRSVLKTNNIPVRENVIKSEQAVENEVAATIVQDFEAKKKYLSALNILEKSDAELQKPKSNEIRTRSKTEEKRERFRVVNKESQILDNLSKCIENVVSNETTAGKKRTSGKESAEIYVKSFAKIDALENRHSSILTAPNKHRARKSFPQPNYSRNISPKVMIPQSLSNTSTTTDTTLKLPIRNAIGVSSASISSSGSNLTLIQSKLAPISSLQQIEPTAVRPANGYLILQQNQSENQMVFLPNQPLNYQSQVVSMAPCLVNTPTMWQRSSDAQNSSNSNNNNHQRLINGTVVEGASSGEGFSIPELTSHNNSDSVENGDDVEMPILSGIVPENITRAVSDIFRRLPPKLKPRPPGIFSQQFREGTPSSAGPLTAKINSVAHKISDYFKGLLIETLEDLGKNDNPEAKIVSLKLEIENLKHKHRIDISEIEKNISTVLQDIQRSIVNERDRIIEETRAACEAETIKRIEEIKSKQWCISCGKEAQFYCCWNTSYCDYPCQQTHWPIHMNKCAQNSSTSSKTNQPLILRPANTNSNNNNNNSNAIVSPSKTNNLGRITKPLQNVNQRVVAPKKMRVQTTSGNLLTMMETTPGNYQLVTSNSLIRTGASLTPLKPKNKIISSSPSQKVATSTSSANNNTKQFRKISQLISTATIVTAEDTD